ncbi:Nitrogen permease regulator 2 [Coemansia sp. RSA 1813]|nr:Nitrogen permease regulator 2 [Coemansia sp. RSA 1646]KAJ1770321.1 Nitrogen permease regulator 2 [Coemansia sp. RSA 1843]KAJ2091664.1 Nitrogen permease regulator 2 [Coemansia sp. RSA 986]KAJ2216934.1 Nitrogen permease regulator 2 [Coemansia sp. RSA 487]KAJ2571937.1 Nitrogen permease regulator 2 [Coemansia sp. RSA 1813]
MASLDSGFPEIRAVFLAQFHPDLGPIVPISVPEDAVDLEQKAYSEMGSVRGDELHNDEGGIEDSTTSPSDAYGRLPNEHGGVVHLIKRPNRIKCSNESDKIDFNSIQTLVIPKLTLFERLITVQTGKHKVMCYPIAVEGAYQRNVFIFNMCFAFDIDANTKCYGPVVKRVGCLLKELEIGGNLLSNPAGKRPLRKMMQQMVFKLNTHGEYQIELDMRSISTSLAATGVSIKLFPHYENPTDIRAYHVPVRIIDFGLARLKSTQTVYQTHMAEDIIWDLVLERVTQCIDNVNHVAKIARLAQIREETVILALKHLDYYGCIALVDIFQFSNVYEVQYQAMSLFENAWLQRECYSYVTNDGQSGELSMKELIGLYATVKDRRSVAEWIIENRLDLKRFDVRRFVVFGVMHCLLRRVYCYPILRAVSAAGAGEVPPTNEELDRERVPAANRRDTENKSETGEEAESAAEKTNQDGVLEPRILIMLDGTHHLDEISVIIDKDTLTLYEMLEEHGGVEYLYL